MMEIDGAGYLDAEKWEVPRVQRQGLGGLAVITEEWST